MEEKNQEVLDRYLKKMSNISKETKDQLYSELEQRIDSFNQNSNRKLELSLGSKEELKRNLNQSKNGPIKSNAASVNPNPNMNMRRPVQQPVMQQAPPQVIMQQAPQPVMMQQMPQQMVMRTVPQPMMMQQMPQQMIIQQPAMNMQMSQIQPQIPRLLPNQITQNNPTINPNQANNKRSLFLGQALGAISGGLGDAASSVGGALGANGGAGAGLLGAGAGLAMATMGSSDEREERDNLGQELRSKEFKFMTKQGQKTSELGLMDNYVRLLLW